MSINLGPPPFSGNPIEANRHVGSIDGRDLPRLVRIDRGERALSGEVELSPPLGGHEVELLWMALDVLTDEGAVGKHLDSLLASPGEGLLDQLATQAPPLEVGVDFGV